MQLRWAIEKESLPAAPSTVAIRYTVEHKDKPCETGRMLERDLTRLLHNVLPT